MENFLFALNTVLPFLLYIAFGYGVRMSGLADEDFMKRLNKVIFQAFFPILMFNNLYSIPEGMTLNLRLVAVAIISVLLLQAVLLAVVPRLVKENERRGVIIQAIYRSNFVLFGIPLATSVFGEEGTLLATMMVAIVIPVYNITAVVILELFRGGKVPVSVLIKNIPKNPMIRGAPRLYLPYIRIKLPVSGRTDQAVCQSDNAAGTVRTGRNAAFQFDRRQSEICGSVDDLQDGDPAGSDSGGCDAARLFRCGTFCLL